MRLHNEISKLYNKYSEKPLVLDKETRENTISVAAEAGGFEYVELDNGMFKIDCHNELTGQLTTISVNSVGRIYIKGELDARVWKVLKEIGEEFR